MTIEQKQHLWDSFVSRWPSEKLEELTLEEYVSVNDQDTFTYWLETKTKDLGSIKGNTSAKFGIYKRGSAGKEQSGIGHGEIYSWRTRYGDDETSVFSYVKKILVTIAKAAYEGDLQTIDELDFAPLVKWKIAFLYQNQQAPSLINTFSKPMLQVLTGSEARISYPEMYQKIVANQGELNLLEYGQQCWSEVETRNKEIERQKILAQFIHIDAFESNVESWNKETTNSFCNIIAAANKRGLDVFVTYMNSGDMICIGRKEHHASNAEAIFATFEPTKSRIKFEQRYLNRDEYLCADVTSDLLTQIRNARSFLAFNEEYKIINRKPLWPSDYSDDYVDDSEDTPGKNDQVIRNTSLNQILYGPPGTGKTYHTVEAAVKAAEPDFYDVLEFEELDIDERRIALKDKYDELVEQKRIRFVTFHQSYGYEEFVEGLKAESDEDSNIFYPIRDGVFKTLCDKASQKTVMPDLIKEDSRIWQLSIESSGRSEVKTYCLDSDIGAIGWGHVGDMTPSMRTSENDSKLTSETHPNQSSIRSFCNDMSIGDIVFCVSGQLTIEAIGVVTGDYKYNPDGILQREDYNHTRPIKWLAKGLELNVFNLNSQTRLPIKTCSELTRFSVPELIAFLGANSISLATDAEFNIENFVLIIDEINRGNISKIFGELITLIEPSKRTGEGQKEALTLNLPYSGKPFSVPSNLYIIGTMNTADRSLALMDTALRRRFDFVEMMPNYEVFNGCAVLNIDDVEVNLAQLLETMNHRIEVLYDREHMLGHAFFIPVAELIKAGEPQKALIELKNVFKNKVLPLLQEYFFEDWNRIRLVLGDSKKTESDWLVKISEKSFDTIFGSDHGLGNFDTAPKTYQIASFDHDSIWDKPETYQAIYNPSKLQNVDVTTDSTVNSENNNG
ncbi:AAA family ATPase [Shewanella sp. 4_MG-2023]|uniref:AAA family ATPase n=1 Tax=Shewanella sp. 4_MG-2023 TaxID=3062652 RepID=UPI0026E37678|nr:AAA family ATPase [Shewanella sp. 4_MG-2023]MDO6678428.1 AAA family ATPase [Shewanella sp. 4_MG-2023]